MDTERVAHLAAAMMPADLSADEQKAEFARRAETSVPLGRLAEGADIANMVAFFASDEAAYLTGLAVTVSGGSVMD